MIMRIWLAAAVMLGLGWSAVTVAGSTMLTDAVTLAERPQAQGVSDTVMGLMAAGGGVLAGVIIAATHALLSDPAVDRLKNSPATEIVVTPEQGGKKAGGHASAEPTRLEYPTITGAKVQVEFTHGGDTDGVGEDV